jgi:hypothetical protein
MRLSAKVEYACMAALELAARYRKNTPVQLSEIAGSQDMPEKFLTQAFPETQVGQHHKQRKGRGRRLIFWPAIRRKYLLPM